MLPGNALLLPEDDFSVRCSYVDYDGEKVLAEYQKNSPQTTEEEDAFVHKHCSLIIAGVANMARYLEQIRQGKRPVHPD